MLVPAGPEVPMHDADLAGGAGPAVGHVRAALLVADGQVLDAAAAAAPRTAGGSPRPGCRRRCRRPRTPGRRRPPPCTGSCGMSACPLRRFSITLQQRGVVEGRRAPGHVAAATSWATRPVSGSDDARLPGRGERDAHVLVVQVDPEPRRELAPTMDSPLEVQDPGAGQPAGQHVEPAPGSTPDASSSTIASATRRVDAADDELVGGLHGLPRPGGPTCTIVVPTTSRIGRAAAKSSGVAADHDRQGAVDAPRSPPLTGASSAADALVGRGLRDPAARSPGGSVLMSMSSVPGPAPPRTRPRRAPPPRPAGESGSMVITTSAVAMPPPTPPADLPAGRGELRPTAVARSCRSRRRVCPARDQVGRHRAAHDPEADETMPTPSRSRSSSQRNPAPGRRGAARRVQPAEAVRARARRRGTPSPTGPRYPEVGPAGRRCRRSPWSPVPGCPRPGSSAICTWPNRLALVPMRVARPRPSGARW